MSVKTQAQPKRRRIRLNFNFFDVFVTLFCIIFAIICFYPLWYVFIVSITPFSEFIKKDMILFFPKTIDLQYYKALFTTTVFKNSIFVSIFKTVFGTLLSVVVTAMTAYGVSKSYVPGMKVLNFLVVLTMYFGGGLIPTYFLYRDIGIIKTIWPMILPMALNTGYFVIMRNYFMYSVPQELEESALLDGANQIQVFFLIVLPTSVAMIVAVGLFIAVFHWNDWYSFMMYVNVNRFQPFAWMLRKVLVEPSFVNNMAAEAQMALEVPKPPPMQLRMTTIIIAVLPIVAVYPFLQKHFSQGMMIGAVKG